MEINRFNELANIVRNIKAQLGKIEKILADEPVEFKNEQRSFQKPKLDKIKCLNETFHQTRLDKK